MNNLTFRECRKFIEALKSATVCLGTKGHEIGSKLENQELSETVIIATSKKHRLILVATEEGFEGFHFNEEEFDRYEILGSFDAYCQESYNFSIFTIDTKKLIAFLKADENSLRTIHASIDFDAGYKERLAYSKADIFIYDWAFGPMVIIYKDNDKEIISFSEARSVIQGDEVLQRVQSLYKNMPCSMKILKLGSSVTNRYDDQFLTELASDLAQTQRYPKTAMPSDEDEDSFLTADTFAESQEHEAIRTDDEEEALFAESLSYQDEQENKKDEEEEKKSEEPENFSDEDDITSKLEDSIVLKSVELPELGPQDLDIFKKYGIDALPQSAKSETPKQTPTNKRDSTTNKMSEEELTAAEKEILEKYGLDIAEDNEEDKEVEDLEASVVLKHEELPELNPNDVSVLSKYGIEFVNKPQPGQKSGQMINNNDIATLQRYNIVLPRGINSTLQEVREAYQSALSLGKLPNKIETADRVVFLKFGLQLPQQKINIPIKYIAMPVVAFVVILLLIVTFKAIRKSQEARALKAECEYRTTEIVECQDEAKAAIKKMRQMVADIKRKFPSSQGYPEPSNNLLSKIKDADKYLEELKAVQTKADEFLDDYANAKKYLYSIEVNEVLKEEKKTLLRQSIERFDKFYQLLQFIYDQEQKQRLIRMAYRNLREAIIDREQRVKALDENWKILQKYPENAGFPPRPKDIPQILKEARNKNRQLIKNLRSIESAMMGSADETLQLIDSQKEDNKSNLVELDSLHGSLIDLVSICMSISNQRKLAQQTMALLEPVVATIDTAEKYFQSIEECTASLDEFPEELEVPRPDIDEKETITSLRRQYKRWTDCASNVRKLISQNQFEEAQKLLSGLSEETFPMATLEQFQLNMQDALNLATSMKEKSETVKEIAQYMRKVQAQSVALETVVHEIEQYDEQCRTVYTRTKGFDPHKIEFSEKLKQGKNFISTFKTILTQVNNSLAQKNLDNALSLLKRSDSNISKSNSLVPELTKIKDDFSKQVHKYQVIAEQKQTIAEIKKYTNQLKKYIEELEEQLNPLEISVSEYKEFSKEIENPEEIPQDVMQACKEAHFQISSIKSTLQTGDNYSTNLQYAEALAYWENQNFSQLINRDVISKVEKALGVMDDLSVAVKRIKDRKEKMIAVNNTLNLLQDRLSQLQLLHPQLQKNIEILTKQYPESEGYLPLNPNAIQTTKDAENEIRELKQAIDRGESWIARGQYDEAIQKLKIYHEPTSTKLRFIKTIADDVEKTIAENQRMSSNADYRQKMEQKKQEELTKKNRRAQWRKSPGVWYNEVETLLQNFDKIRNKIDSSLNGGSVHIFPRVLTAINELRRIPDDIAELQEMIYNIEQNGGNIAELLDKREELAMTSRIKREVQLSRLFHQTRSMDVSVANAISEAMSLVEKIRYALEEEKASYVNEQDLKSLQKVLQSATTKYEDVKQPIYSTLTSIEMDTKHQK